MRMRTLALMIVAGLAAGCFFGSDDEFHAPIHEQRLPSGKVVKVVSCLLTWGAEHDQRLPDRDAFEIDYISAIPRVPPQELEKEAVEVFELIRPIAEQWGMPLATVTALRSADRTGTWDVFAFNRSASGAWTHTSQAISRNKE